MDEDERARVLNEFLDTTRRYFNTPLPGSAMSAVKPVNPRGALAKPAPSIGIGRQAEEALTLVRYSRRARALNLAR